MRILALGLCVHACTKLKCNHSYSHNTMSAYLCIIGIGVKESDVVLAGNAGVLTSDAAFQPPSIHRGNSIASDIGTHHAYTYRLTLRFLVRVSPRMTRPLARTRTWML